MKTSYLLCKQILVTTMVFFFFSRALAVDTPTTLTLEGNLFDSGFTGPLAKTGILNIKILDPSENCILYEEEQAVDTTTNTKGRFQLQVGSPPSDARRAGDDPNNSMMRVLQNRLSIPAINASCTGGAFVPTAGQTRKLRFTWKPTVGPVEVMAPDLILNSIPNTLLAETLQGHVATDFLRLDTVTPLTQGHAENVFSSTNYPILTGLLAGSSSLYLTTSATGVNVPFFATDPVSSTPGQMWFNSTSNVMKYWNGSQARTLATWPTNLSLSVNSTSTSGTTVLNYLTTQYSPASDPVSGAKPVSLENSIATSGSADLTNAEVSALKTTVTHAANTTAGSITARSNEAKNTGAGNVDYAYGQFVDVVNSSSGSIGTAYGLYLGPIAGTVSYGIYQSDSSARSGFFGRWLTKTSYRQEDPRVVLPFEYIKTKGLIEGQGMKEATPAGSVSITGGTLVNGGPTKRNVGASWQGMSAGDKLTWDYGSGYQRMFTVQIGLYQDPNYVPRSITLESSTNCSTWTTILNDVYPNGNDLIYDQYLGSARCVRLTVNTPGISGTIIPNIRISGLGYENGALSPWGWNEDRVAFLHSGKLGIGVTVPSNKFDVRSSDTGNVLAAAARSNPGGAGAGFRNSMVLDNRHATNAKNDFSFQSAGTYKWDIANDNGGSGGQNIAFYDAVAGQTRVGIGTTGVGLYNGTAPASAFDVSGSLSIGAYAGVTAGPTNGMIVSGWVGIGTDNPSAPLDVAGHVAIKGPNASVASCGTGATISGGDTRGTVTTGTGTVTSCRVNFASTYTSTPHCVVTWNMATAPTNGIASAPATTNVTVKFVASAPSTTFNYFCMQ